MTQSNLRALVRSGVSIGTFISINSTAVVEKVGSSGIDFLVLDAEHTALSISDLDSLLRSAALVGAAAVVRVPEVGSYIGRVLDAGAAGIVAPRIETAEQAAEAVSRVRYPPEGVRGLGPGRGGYPGGPIAEHLRSANDRVLLIVQIETRLGVENAEAILSTPGVDALLVGPADLAASLGVELGADAHRKAIETVFTVAEKHSVVPGAASFTDSDTEMMVALGARMLTIGSDSMFLASGADEVAAQAVALKAAAKA